MALWLTRLLNPTTVIALLCCTSSITDAQPKVNLRSGPAVLARCEPQLAALRTSLQGREPGGDDWSRRLFLEAHRLERLLRENDHNAATRARIEADELCRHPPKSVPRLAGPVRLAARELIACLSADVSGPTIDADENGIRDDVDSRIRARFGGNPPFLRAAFQFAAALQAAMSASDDRESAIVRADALFKGMDCLYSFGDRLQAKNAAVDILSATANTRQKSLAYARFSYLIRGHTFAVASRHSELNCQ